MVATWKRCARSQTSTMPRTCKMGLFPWQRSTNSRLRILRNLEEGSAFYETKAGKRMLKAVLKKMELENLTTQDFAVQKKNGWKLQGKTFYKIFAEVEHEDFYPATYGMMSESIHGS